MNIQRSKFWYLWSHWCELCLDNEAALFECIFLHKEFSFVLLLSISLFHYILQSNKNLCNTSISPKRRIFNSPAFLSLSSFNILQKIFFWIYNHLHFTPFDFLAFWFHNETKLLSFFLFEFTNVPRKIKKIPKITALWIPTNFGQRQNDVRQWQTWLQTPSNNKLSIFVQWIRATSIDNFRKEKSLEHFASQIWISKYSNLCPLFQRKRQKEYVTFPPCINKYIWNKYFFWFRASLFARKFQMQ